MFNFVIPNDPEISPAGAFDKCRGMMDGARRLGEVPEDEGLRKLFGMLPGGPVALLPSEDLPGQNSIIETTNLMDFQDINEEEISAVSVLAKGYTAEKLVVTPKCAGQVLSACGSGTGFSQPTGWASLLYKTTARTQEYVVAFQSMEVDNPIMVPYIMNQDPVLVTYESETGTGLLYPTTAFSTSIVIQEGYALYMGQVIPCVEKMLLHLSEVNKKLPSFIAGFSLGGAAATAYAQFLASGESARTSSIFGSETFLVTFGSPPTLWKQSLKGKRAPIYYEIDVKDPSAPKPFNGWKSVYAYDTIVKDSVRFFHKFDPVPSSLFYQNLWAHQTTEGYMLFDYPTASCNYKPIECATVSTSVGTGTARDTTGWKANTGFVTEMKTMTKNIHGLLCDKYDVIPSAKKFSWSDNFVYYSYMNMFNPMPCAEVLLSAAFKTLAYNNIAFAPEKKPFHPKETFFDCTITYIGTLAAYYETYLAGDLEDFRGGLEWETDYIANSVYLLAWGLMTVHQAYPYYPLCGEYGETDFMSEFTDGNPISTFTDIIKESLPGFTPGPGSGSGSRGWGPYDWQNDPKGVSDPYSKLSTFWDGQLKPRNRRRSRHWSSLNGRL